MYTTVKLVGKYNLHLLVLQSELPQTERSKDKFNATRITFLVLFLMELYVVLLKLTKVARIVYTSYSHMSKQSSVLP